jgi:hypothetical protein
MITQRYINRGMTILAVMALAACGGSGSSAPALTEPLPTGGITGTGSAIIMGSISGFGSIIVNGTSYDTAAAIFTIDGESGTQSDLAVGDVVVVKGTVTDGTSGANSRVRR